MLTLSGIPQNRIITVYAEEEIEFQGYLLSWDAGHTLLACVDRYGENDGFLLLHTDSLYRIDYDSLYEQKLETLYTEKKQSHDAPPLPGKNETLLQSVLSWVQWTHKLARFAFSDQEDLCGYIETIDPLQIRQMDLFTCQPGHSSACVIPENVDFIWIDNRQARDAELIFQARGETDV